VFGMIGQIREQGLIYPQTTSSKGTLAAIEKKT